jgi:hypothetical protein
MYLTRGATRVPRAHHPPGRATILSSTSWLIAQINGVVTYPPWPDTAVASARTFQNGSFGSEIGRVPPLEVLAAMRVAYQKWMQAN